MTTAAKDFRETDVMMLRDGSFSRVTRVVDIQLNRKVQVFTAGGSFFANQVLTSGMCERYEQEDLNVPATSVLESYAATHAELHSCFLTAKEFSIQAVLGACLAPLS